MPDAADHDSLDVIAVPGEQTLLGVLSRPGSSLRRMVGHLPDGMRVRDMTQDLAALVERDRRDLDRARRLPGLLGEKFLDGIVCHAF